MEILIVTAVLVAGVLVAITIVLATRKGDATAERIASLEATVAQGQQQLLTSNQQLLETERARMTAELDGKKSLIDQQSAQVQTELGHVRQVLQELGGKHERAYGSLAATLREQAQAVAGLNETTGDLHRLLSDSRTRGQWGERMADDVLRHAGLKEGTQYRKQSTLESGGRPDFTFLLPDDRELHMDVKFPLDSYVASLDASTDAEREQHEKVFINAAKSHIKALARRDYGKTRGRDLDCVLLFIPNEAIYAWLHEREPGLLDDALAQAVVLCSPSTLFAVLAVIRQAAETFVLAEATDQILTLLGKFEEQWGKFKDQMDKVGQAIDRARDAHQAAVGARTNQLEKPLEQLDRVRRQRGLDDEAPALRAIEG